MWIASDFLFSTHPKVSHLGGVEQIKSGNGKKRLLKRFWCYLRCKVFPAQYVCCLRHMSMLPYFIPNFTGMNWHKIPLKVDPNVPYLFLCVRLRKWKVWPTKRLLYDRFRKLWCRCASICHDNFIFGSFNNHISLAILPD